MLFFCKGMARLASARRAPRKAYYTNTVIYSLSGAKVLILSESCNTLGKENTFSVHVIKFI